ncbi:MAG TPA: saccharopine dehydrogenase NADP-binding domain-containing protein [Propionibacteriaceae bacterium]
MKIVVVGAGGIGQWTAHQIGMSGGDVILASRSGTGIGPGVSATPNPKVAKARVDATDASALAELADGADVLVNAVNPPYTQWDELWPPMAAAFLEAAERSGAALLTIGNLYPYGRPTTAPMTESSPVAPNGHKGQIRARMWHDAEEAHRAGRIRAVELRAADYFGPGVSAGMSYLNQYAIKPAIASKTAHHIMGVVDAPHSWTYVPDIGRLAAAIATSDPAGDAWGRVWHVPTTPPKSLTDVAKDAAAIAGVPARPPRPYSRIIKTVMRVSPLIRELDEMAPAFEAPYVLDSSAAEARFGLAPTPWRDALEETVTWLRAG